MKRFALLGALVVLACGPKARPIEPPVEEEVPFEGESSSNLPDFTDGVIDAGQYSPVDAGEIVTETRCCRLNFVIGGEGEPANAVGRLEGEAFPLSDGVTLTSGVDGGFAASACVPINTSTYYWYVFEWTTSDADAGGLALEDGGFWVRVERYNPDQLNYTTADGSNRNFVPAVDDCALLDAGTGP